LNQDFLQAQIMANDLLLKVTQYRTEYPQKIKEQLQKEQEISKQEELNKLNNEEKVELEAQVDIGMISFYSMKFKRNIF